ncbi:MAG: flagellar hook-length control protein FliK [Planctomycetota bacterium]
MGLLESLFDGPGIDIGTKDHSRDLGLGPQKDLVRVPDESDPHVHADPLRDFAALRDAGGQEPDEVPYEETAAQISMQGTDQQDSGTTPQFVPSRQVTANAGAGQEQLPFQMTEQESGAPVPEPPPAPAPRIQPPVQKGTLAELFGQQFEDLQAAAPRPGPAVAQPNPAAIPPGIQALVAPVQFEAPPPEGGRPGTMPIRPVDSAAGRSPADRAASARPSESFTSRLQERVEFVERIVRAAKLAESKGQTKLRIVLRPPHLGRMKVQLSVEDHVLQGRIQADQSATRELILNHMQELKESLEQQGIEVGDFQVDVEQGAEQPAQDFQREPDEAPESPPSGTPGIGQAGADSEDGSVWVRSARLQVLDLVA